MRAFYHAIGSFSQAYTDKALFPLKSLFSIHSKTIREPVELEPARFHGGT